MRDERQVREGEGVVLVLTININVTEEISSDRNEWNSQSSSWTPVLV